MDKQITKKQAGVGSLLLSLAITAAMFALPVVDGGLYNLAYFICWGAAWVFSVTMFLCIFIAPLDVFIHVPLVRRAIGCTLKYSAIAWLVWHGMVLLPTLFLIAEMFGFMVNQRTRQEYEKQLAEGDK